MQTIMIDGSRYATPEELHRALQRMLRLPDYYGCNADALHDCLSGRSEPVHLWIASRGEGPVEETVSLVSSVIADLGGRVKEMNA